EAQKFTKILSLLCLFVADDSSRGAGLGVPARCVGHLLEVGAHHPGFAEILGIPDLRDDREPSVTVRGVHKVIVLGEIRIRTVGNAVLAGIACPQTGGHHPQIPFTRLASSRDGSLPLSRGITLPTGLRCRRLLWAKMEEPGLSSGGQFHFQRVVVLPGNAEISGQTHDTDGAISLTLFAGRLVLCRIPRIGGSKRFDSAGNTVKVTFSRCDHAILPIFGDDGNPCSRNIERGSHFRWLWSWCAALASLRVSIDRENQTKNHYQERALPPNN